MRDEMLSSMCAKSRFEPRLLLFAAFLSSVAIYTPNMRVMKRCAENPDVITVFFLSMTIACAVLALGFAIRSMRVRAFSFGRSIALASAAVYSFAQIVVTAIASCTPASSQLLFVAGVLGAVSAFCAGVVLSIWIRVFDMGFRGVMLNGACACAACAILVCSLSCLPDAVVRVAMPALAALGSFGFLAFDKNPVRDRSSLFGQAANAQESRVSSEESTGFRKSLFNLLSVIWLPLLGLLLCVFMMNVYSIDAVGISVSECTGCLIASVLAIVVCVMCKKAPLIFAVDRLVLPACAAASIVLGSFPMGTPLFFLGAYSVYAPLVFVSLYALASILSAARSGEFPPALAFGTLVFAASGVALAGFVLALALGANPVAHGTLLWILLCIYFGIVMLNLGWQSWKQAVNPSSDSSECASADEEGSLTKDLLEQLRAERVAQVATEHGLTAREAELLDYMSRGHSSSYIAQVLFISPSTVRTHFRNIYRKLDVRSREELLTLFNT